MKLSDFLQQKLKTRGMQAKFARATGISDGTASKWARGGMDRSPNFENCIRIAAWAKMSPIQIFDMAEKPEYADLFLGLFPNYNADSSTTEPPICPDNNPAHIAYHEILEKVLHHADARLARIVMRVFAIIEDEINANDGTSSSRSSSEGTRRSGPTKATEEGGRTARKDISSR